MKPLSEQIKGVQEAREIVGHISQDGRLHIPIPSEGKLIEISDSLNDAGSTLAYLNLTKDLPEREEYFTRLYALIDKHMTTQSEQLEEKAKQEALRISYDRLKLQEDRIKELEEALKVTDSNLRTACARLKFTSSQLHVDDIINKNESLLKQ